MEDDETRRRQVRRMLAAGHLPPRRPDRVWGGAAYGGYPCMVCDGPIRSDEVAMEVEYEAQLGPSAHLHTRCFLALEQELLLVERHYCASPAMHRAGARAASDEPRQAGPVASP